VPIDEWKKSGLKLPFIRVHKIATLEKELVESCIGKINEAVKIKTKRFLSNLTE
jgi:hypothetical protein